MVLVVGGILGVGVVVMGWWFFFRRDIGSIKWIESAGRVYDHVSRGK